MRSMKVLAAALILAAAPLPAVHAHGGEMHCQSREGAGTTFWFTLPLATKTPEKAA